MTLEKKSNNPVIEGLYADPDLYYEKGIYYIYPTTDGFPHWSGNEFYVFTSRDGKHFKRKNRILDVASQQVLWATGSAWAPCIARKEDTYYFYFCAKDETGKSCIGVAYSTSPTGPFTAMDEPMLTMEMMHRNGIEMSQTIDPSIYQDGEDYYILFGNGQAALAKLEKDMVHINEETLQNIKGLKDFREAVTVFKKDDRYHFTWSCDDTGSEDYHVNYGVSDSLAGEVTYVDTILKKKPECDIMGTGHHSICFIPDQDKYLIAYHRFATPLSQYPEGKGWHREVCIDTISFTADGYIQPVTPNGNE